jgi:hypothetical protein
MSSNESNFVTRARSYERSECRISIPTSRWRSCGILPFMLSRISLAFSRFLGFLSFNLKNTICVINSNYPSINFLTGSRISFMYSAAAAFISIG